MTTLTWVVVMVLAMLAGARWLGIPGRVDGGRDDAVDESVRASMRRHPSALTALDRPLGERPPADRPPLASTPPLHARARVVFAGVQDGRLVLDCVIAQSAEGGVVAPAGLPISLSLGELDTPWMAVHVEAMLERWAD